MKIRLLLIMTLMLGMAGMAAAQIPQAEQDAITKTITGYISKNAQSVKNAVHPEVCRMMSFSPPQMKADIVIRSGYSEIMAAALHPQRPAPILQNLDIHVFKENVAAATLVTDQFTEEILLAKIQGNWLILNLLQKNLRMPASGAQDTDTAAIEATARDYIEGAFSGNADRMERAIHFDMHKVVPRTQPGSDITMLQYSPYELMIKWTASGTANLPEEKWEIKYKLLHKLDNIAMAEVLSSQYYDYIQLSRVDGQWKIVNVLWVPNPSAPRRH
ncbi:nuclear transport factor 2 family protein [bacterium]|nr:nuclear transport factor 2 family protein [bacterium]